MKTVFVLSLIFSATLALAQDGQTSIKLDKFEYLHETVFLNDRGLVLKAGPLNEKQPQRLLHYSADGQLVWTTQIENHYGLRNSNNFILASPNGAVVYYVELKDDGFPNKTQYVSRVTQDGKAKNFQIEANHLFGESLQTVFCDDDYLYYLSTEKGNERHDSKKSSEKLIMTRLGHTEVAPRKITLALPSVAGGNNTTFWSFVGQNGSEKFFISKTISPESPNQVIDIAVIDRDSQLLRKSTMEVVLDGVFPRPAVDVEAVKTGVFQNVDLDFNEVYVPGSPATGSPASSAFSTPGRTRLSHNSGAFAHVSYDHATGSFYVYGLFGPKPYKRVGPVHEGFFIHKFGRDGKNVWKVQYKGTKDLMGESIFRVHGTPADRTIALRMLPEEKLNFSVHFKRTLFTYEVSADGKIVTSRRKDKYDDLSDVTIVCKPALKSDAYIKSKSVIGANYLSSAGELLVVPDEDNSEIDLIFFKLDAE